MVDAKTWKIDKYQSGKEKERLKEDIGPLAGGQCKICPKNANFKEDYRGPQNEKYSKLSEANVKTIELYHRFRACGWDGLPPEARGDAILVKNFAVVDQVIREWEDHRRTKDLAGELLPIILMGKV